ncbi:HNH endonuclease signature motif containing protein [Allocoleopsis franciscana]|uniref:HNH endonuclease n=1 Tax=Allocoleopsis franciscana PCC 7113 TaxID=1173027 RepID=K9WF16_9CYAN|nr:HNH endonuclease signature motif containing protein [Allocoleopsis franciscana]AFZ18396.1 hypothetical protein Mic7113_2604 [Allocoleopsis franciscana PCC 7113]
MGNRKPIPPQVEINILLASARRCALCFGFEGDFTRKKGQIAHIDQDSSNPDEANLVYLCFEHHDEYDSSTSQSKGITQSELREYKKSLLAAISRGEHTRSDEPVQGIGTVQEFKNDNSGVQVNSGNTAIGHQTVYNQQASEFFDEVKNGVRTTYRRDPVTGALIVVSMSLA